jgi:isochorismate synthase
MSSDSFFDNIESHFEEGLPFAVYCKPNSFDVKAILQRDDTLYKIEDYTESGFVFAPFDFRKDAVLMPYAKCSIHTLDENVYLEDKGVPKYTEILYDESHFINLVEKGLKGITREEFKKVVLSRKEIVKFDSFDVIQSFKILLNIYSRAFVYCWFHPKVGLWLGATPEMLMHVKGDRFSTMALAGTQLYEGTLDVKWQNKEIHEQEYVIDFITESIKSIVTDISVSETETVRAGNVLHIKSDINGTLVQGSDNFRKLLMAIHPTPAVCGIPKLDTMQFILDNEGYNREFYTGFMGELHKEIKLGLRGSSDDNVSHNIDARESHLFVNLRCMQVKPKEAYVYIGCGITEESDPKEEWQETVNKAKTIKKVIGF